MPTIKELINDVVEAYDSKREGIVTPIYKFIGIDGRETDRWYTYGMEYVYVGNGLLIRPLSSTIPRPEVQTRLEYTQVNVRAEKR